MIVFVLVINSDEEQVAPNANPVTDKIDFINCTKLTKDQNHSDRVCNIFEKVFSIIIVDI